MTTLIPGDAGSPGSILRSHLATALVWAEVEGAVVHHVAGVAAGAARDHLIRIRRVS